MLLLYLCHIFIKMAQEIYHEDRYIVFGSGEIVHFENYVPLEEKGTTWYGFFITDNNPEVREKYSLKYGEEINEQDGLIRMKYRKKDVVFLPPSGRNQLVLIKTDFRGKDTSLSKEHTDKDEQISILEVRNESLHISNMKLMEEMDTLTVRYEQYIKNKVRLVKAAQIAPPKAEDDEEKQPPQPTTEY